MSALRPTMIGLSASDHAALTRMAQETHTTMSDVVRWAIRHYAGSGPWTTRSSVRRAVVRLIKLPTIGPVVIQEGGTNGQTA